jgi:type II secretory pathway pseudopilin PulG
MLGHRERIREGGDTIVEVMVVLAILGLAIGISFATANRSLLDTNQAEENSQATDYAESQVEDLRYLAPTSSSANPSQDPGSNIFNPSTTFCITSPTATTPITTTVASCVFGAQKYQVLIYNCDRYSADDADNNPCAGASAASDTFIIVATWPNILGQGSDSATLSYRVHVL